jgi:hypothetical protein
MLEVDTNKTASHLFVDNVIQPLCIMNVRLPFYFIIGCVGKIDQIEFRSLPHAPHPTYTVEFMFKTEYVKFAL